MPYMVVTLEVPKLSGWLNADAPCRESNGGHTVWYEVQSTGRPEVAGDRGARSVQGRARLQTRNRARAERTNMAAMFVTLDVSKFSGWLNADTDCRVEKRAYDVGRGVDREAGGHGLAAAYERHARREGPVVKAGG